MELRLEAALPLAVLGPRLTIGIRLGVPRKKGQARSVTLCVDSLLDRLNSFGSFGRMGLRRNSRISYT